MTEQHRQLALIKDLIVAVCETMLDRYLGLVKAECCDIKDERTTNCEPQQEIMTLDDFVLVLVLQAEPQLDVRLQNQRKAWPWHFLYSFSVAEDIIDGSSEPPYA